MDPTASIVPIDLRAVRQRLTWVGVALAVIVVLMVVGDPVVEAHRSLWVANAVLFAAAVAAALIGWRGRWSAGAISALGMVLASLLSAVTLLSYRFQPDQRFVVMMIVQMIGAALLFVSLPWLITYLATLLAAAGGVMHARGRVGETPLLAACAVLAVTSYLTLRDRQRRHARAHADQLAKALALARMQLEAKEVAERDSERLQAQLLHAQKMEAIGTLAGGVAHDMNNALAAIIGFAECIHDDTTEPKIREDAEQILLAANRAADLTRNLLGVGRRGQFRLEPVRPESLVTGVATLLARTLPKGVRVETTFADELAGFEVDTASLTHALVNLGLNAADAMDGQGVLALGARLDDVDRTRAATLELEPGRHVVLSVRDTGAGIDAALLPRIFEPFFTTKPQGRGTGLGLAMVYGTVKRHGGAIHVDSAPGRGTRFEIFLRAATTEAIPTVRVRSVSPPPIDRRGGRVLVIDDEELVRAVMTRTLERAGYVVETAVHGQDGLDVLATSSAPFDLIILDMAMPVLAGPETFRRARAREPGLKVLLSSGFTSAEDARALIEEGALGLIEKPCAPAALLAAVERAIARTAPERVTSRAD